MTTFLLTAASALHLNIQVSEECNASFRESSELGARGEHVVTFL